MKDFVHRQIIKNIDSVSDWFQQKSLHPYLPFYSSFDMRDSGYKITNVDANLFPAGFNNICEVDRDEAPNLVSQYLERCYNLPKNAKIVLLTEEHTRNAYYWENIYQILNLLEGLGHKVKLCVPKKLEKDIYVQSATGRELIIVSWWQLKREGFVPDVVINNNDFSSHYEEWEASLQEEVMLVNPPWQLGWRWRKKSDYFFHFNSLAETFAQIIDVDPWVFTVRTEVFSNFSINERGSRDSLASIIQTQIDELSEDYAQRKIDRKPTVFVKNNSGTYGMGIIAVSSGEEFLQLNNRARTKMKASKGGEGIGEVIVQEGIPSSLLSGQSVAEPVLYLVGEELAGGFLRTHKDKGVVDNLNSPGAVYKRLCVSDLKINVEGSPLENVYGWVAKLGVLALAMEIKSKKIKICSCSELEN